MPSPACQAERRERLYARHRPTIDEWWDADGRFVWPQAPEAHGGWRAVLWHCLSYLSGDAHCVAQANTLIRVHAITGPCHFAPGAAIDVLLHHPGRLEPDVRDLLVGYLRKRLDYMTTEDLRIHGYNDNHPFKAMHALVVGGEMLGAPHLVACGLAKLRLAERVYARNGFPCEYNSGTYTPVSLTPLACLAEQAKDPEARDLAVRLERFVWRDLALHFDPRAGMAAGPMSRGYTHDHTGQLSNLLVLLQHLWPQRFAWDAADEIFGKRERSALIDPAIIRESLPFYAAHPVWMASATFHVDEAIERAIFDRPAEVTVRGTAESGTTRFAWKDPATAPKDAPAAHHVGPRRSLLTTWYGARCSLGTSQYGWLDSGQAHGLVATLAGSRDGDTAAGTAWYSRMFFDERSPHGADPRLSNCFREEGDLRTVQHRGTALALYNPHPVSGVFGRLRCGLFRLMRNTRPDRLFVGETEVQVGCNATFRHLAPIAVEDHGHYLGLIPLRLTDRGQARQAAMEVVSSGTHLSLLMSSFEDWGPRRFAFEDIIETHAGFVVELHEAAAFPSFADFRRWLAAAVVEDEWYADMRTTTYRRPGLELSSCYSPWQNAFRFAAVDGRPVETAEAPLEGMPDPGHRVTAAMR